MKSLTSVKRSFSKIFSSSSRVTEENDSEKIHETNPLSKQSSRNNICIDIFHDAENCMLRKSTNGSKLFDVVVKAIVSSTFPDFDYALSAHSLVVAWRLVLPFHSYGDNSLMSPQSSQSDSISANFFALRQCIRDLQTRGVMHVNPGDKKGAVDICIKDILDDFCVTHEDDNEDKKMNRVIVLISGDRDFASNIRSLMQKGFKVLLIYTDVISQSFVDVLPEGKTLSIWKNLVAEADMPMTDKDVNTSGKVYSSRRSTSKEVANPSAQDIDFSRLSNLSSRGKKKQREYGGNARSSSQSQSTSINGSSSEANRGRVTAAGPGSRQTELSPAAATQLPPAAAAEPSPSSETVRHQPSRASEDLKTNTLINSNVATTIDNSESNVAEVTKAVHDDRLINSFKASLATGDLTPSVDPKIIFTEEYINSLSLCAKALFIELARSPGRCLHSSGLYDFMRGHAEYASSLKNVTDFSNRKDSGDLFSWQRCWYHSVLDCHSPLTQSQPQTQTQESAALGGGLNNADTINHSQGKVGDFVMQLRYQPEEFYSYLLEKIDPNYIQIGRHVSEPASASAHVAADSPLTDTANKEANRITRMLSIIIALLLFIIIFLAVVIAHPGAVDWIARVVASQLLPPPPPVKQQSHPLSGVLNMLQKLIPLRMGGKMKYNVKIK